MSARGAMRWAGGVFVLATVAALSCPAVRAGDPLGKPYDDVLAEDVKALVPVMRAAAKSDHRRQAWYAARRITAVDPKHAEALEVVARWKPEELVEGVPPEKGFLARRDAAFAKVGGAYAALARTLTAQGRAPTDFFAVVERALAYGNRDADTLQSLVAGKYAWAGSWGPVATGGAWDEWIVPLGGAVIWPPEWDDDVLKAKAFWPDARSARLWGWRFVTSIAPEQAWRVLGTLAAEESHLVETLGSQLKVPKDPKREADELYDLLLIPDPAVYDKIGNVRLRDEDRPKFEGSSGWQDRNFRRLYVTVKHRIDPWIGDDATWLGFAARVLVRRHLGPLGGGLSGRGTWILDGVQGAYEGFVPKGTTGGEIDPARCWRLAAAKALRETKALLPWDQILDLDRKQADDLARARAHFRFAGADRDVEKVDVVAAQATALVVGILRAEGGKGAKRLSTLLEETMKRDRMPDLDKTLGWPKGRAVQEAMKALDAVESK